MSKTRGRKSKNATPEANSETARNIVRGDTKVYILAESLMNDTPKKIVPLKHPATGLKSYYLLAFDDKEIFEVMEFNEPNRSWFVDDTVCSNGKLYITTKIDPIFLVINYLRENCMENASPLDQIIKDTEFPDTHLLIDFITDDQLGMVAEQKGSADLRAFKYSDDKIMVWLKAKLKKLKEALKAEGVHTGSGVSSASFVKSENVEDEASEDEQNVYAHGLLSDYLCKELVIQLSEALGLPKLENKVSKRKSVNSLESPDTPDDSILP